MAVTGVERFSAPEAGGMTDAMRAAWRRDGFLVVDGFKSADACKALMDRARTIIDSYDETDGKTIFETDRQTHSGDDYFRTSGDKVRLFFEEGAVDHEGRLLVDRHQAVNKIGHAMHDLDPVFSEFSRDPRMEALARDAGQVDPGLIQSMIIYKPPRIGGEVHCHQDATFLHTTPQSCVGFWFALEDATLENGCLQAVAGAHFAPLTSRFRYIDGDLVTEQIGPPLWNDADAVPLEAPTGTLVMLHGQLPHFSGPNRSDKARRAYAVHTIDRTAKWSPDNWLRRAPDMPVRGFS